MDIKSKLIDIFGPEKVFDSDLDKLSYSYDASFIPLKADIKPDYVVKAANTQQISNLMKLAFEQSIPVIVRGRGSGRTGGTMPVKGSIILCMDEMNKILEFDEKNLMLTVEPGVLTKEINNFVEKYGLFYPPDPSSLNYSSIGGNIAENAGGAKAVKYGVTSNYVMGLEVVLADGTVLNTGGKAIKNVTGYNLTSLFVGSEGTLGIITKATLRLMAKPSKRKTIQVMFSTLEGACEAVSKSIQSGLVPSSAELMDKDCIETIARFRKMDLDKNVEAAIIFEFDGDNDEVLELQVPKMEEICKECGAIKFRAAKDQAEADELWSLRRGMGPACALLAPNRISEDISVPRGALPEIIKRLQDISKKYDIHFNVFGHAGDGNLHPAFYADLSKPSEQEKVDKAVKAAFHAAIELGGTLSGEHGIGITKKDFIEDALGKIGVETLKRVKQAFDPKNILNPGKIF